MKKIFIVLSLAVLLPSCYKLQVNQEFDTTGNWYSKFSMAEYLNSDDNEFTIFTEAAKHSGFMEDIASCHGKTFIVPTDKAFMDFLASEGLQSVTEFARGVLYSFLKYMELPVVIKSTDFAVDENLPIVSGSGRPVYLTRKSTGNNKYRLYVNTFYPSYVKKQGGPSATVTMQDMLFNDGNIVHVVDAVPYYAPIVQLPEVFTGTLQTEKKTVLETNIDTYIYNHAGFDVPQSSRAICCNSERVPVIWYYDKDLNFTDEIASAKVYFYRSSSSAEGTVATDFTLHDISDQVWTLTANGTDAGALLNAVVATFLPSNTVENSIVSFPPASTQNTWFSVDITSYVKEYYARPREDRIPLAFSLSPVIPFRTGVGLLPLGWKNNSTGSMANNPSYLEILGPIPSRTVVKNLKELDCATGGSAVVTSGHLRRTASDDPGKLNLIDRNITYSLSTLPSHGTLTLNGIPLTIGRIFNQSQINAGVVQYFNSDAATSDSFYLSCSDYTGSITPEDIEFKVNIK